MQKFVMPDAPMQPLIAYWEMLRMGDRPESRSWAGYLRNDEVERAASRERASSRGSNNGVDSGPINERKRRARHGSQVMDVSAFKKNLTSSLKKNKKSGGTATFSQKGGKDQQKKEALAKKKAKKEELRKRQDAAIADANKDPRGALGMLEKKMAKVDKNIQKKQKQIAKMKRVERTTAKRDQEKFEALWDEIGGNEGHHEGDEFGGDRLGVMTEGISNDRLGEDKGEDKAIGAGSSPSKFSSFKQALFSPIGKLKNRGNRHPQLIAQEIEFADPFPPAPGEETDAKGDGGFDSSEVSETKKGSSIRSPSLKVDLMSKMGTLARGPFSPLKRASRSGGGKGGEGGDGSGGNKTEAAGKSAAGLKEVAPSSELELELEESNAPGSSKKKKKKQKKKNRGDGEGGDQGDDQDKSNMEASQRIELERNKRELARLEKAIDKAKTPPTKGKRQSVSFKLPQLQLQSP